VVLRLVRIDQGHKNLQLVRFRRARSRAPKALIW
jgi:hypothetical protein